MHFICFTLGLPQSGSWQDLKDHMREAGDVCYADVFRDGTGVVEFVRKEDMTYAVRKLDNTKFRSHEVSVLTCFGPREDVIVLCSGEFTEEVVRCVSPKNLVIIKSIHVLSLHFQRTSASPASSSCLPLLMRRHQASVIC